MVADTDALNNHSESEARSLLGEAHIIIEGEGEAILEIMLIDRSVRRRALICETLLLVILYGADELGIVRFTVMLDPNANPATENRVLFAARPEDDSDGNQHATCDGLEREDLPQLAQARPIRIAGAPTHSIGSGADAPAPPAPAPAKGAQTPRKNSIDGKGGRIGNLKNSMKRIFARSKTTYLSKLTRHLLNEDVGEHWPTELDFEQVEPERIELNLSPAAVASLHEQVKQVKRIGYASLFEGTVPAAKEVRIDGRKLTLVPYLSSFTQIVHGWMQEKTMHTGFGVLAPTVKQEISAQKMMENDAKCHSFVVCTQSNPGDNRSPAVPIGRAQLVVVSDTTAQIHIGLAGGAATTAARDMYREATLSLLFYAASVLNVRTITQVAATAVLPDPDPLQECWSDRLDFEQSADGKALRLVVDDRGVQLALKKLARGFIVRRFDPKEFVLKTT